MKLTETSREAVRDLVTNGALAKEQLHFVVDVGATNTRFGFVGTVSANTEIFFYKLTVKSVAKLNAAFVDLVSFVGDAVCQRVTSTAMNIPGPTSGLVGGPIANYEGTNEEKVVDIKKFPAILFPQGATMLLNDLEAGAYGVIAASNYGLVPELFDVLWTPQGVADTAEAKKLKELEKGHIVVLAPGTGLGTAFVQYHTFTSKYTVLPAEFGHTSVQSRKHRDFLDMYEKKVQRGDHAIEYDDLCAGRGLEQMYSFITKSDGAATKTPAHEIAQLAKAGDKAALEAMAMFFEFLMRIGSQLAMGFLPRYIVVIGDNLVNNAFFFNEARTKVLRSQFLDHSMERYGFMSRVTMLKQGAPTNFNLIGCAFATQLEAQHAEEQRRLKSSKL